MKLRGCLLQYQGSCRVELLKNKSLVTWGWGDHLGGGGCICVVKKYTVGCSMGGGVISKGILIYLDNVHKSSMRIYL